MAESAGTTNLGDLELARAGIQAATPKADSEARRPARC